MRAYVDLAILGILAWFMVLAAYFITRQTPDPPVLALIAVVVVIKLIAPLVKYD